MDPWSNNGPSAFLACSKFVSVNSKTKLCRISSSRSNRKFHSIFPLNVISYCDVVCGSVNIQSNEESNYTLSRENNVIISPLLSPSIVGRNLCLKLWETNKRSKAIWTHLEAPGRETNISFGKLSHCLLITCKYVSAYNFMMQDYLFQDIVK